MKTETGSCNTVDENFAGLPPFPDDISTAPLLRLSLAKLLAENEEECEKLFQSSIDIGFFYLDLRGSGEELLNNADDLFEVGKELFELSLEEKMKYDFSSQNSYFGYKGQGLSVVDKQGNLDRNEFYNVSKPTPAFDPEYGITDGSERPQKMISLKFQIPCLHRMCSRTATSY